MEPSAIFRDFSTIDIPKGSLVLLCGVPNSGKSTWAKKNFEQQYIVDSDVILDSFVNQYTPDQMSFKELDSLYHRENAKRVVDVSKFGVYTVVDSISTSCFERLSFIHRFRSYFTNVILIAFKVNLFEIMMRPAKKLPTSNYSDWGFSYPTKFELAIMYREFMNSINDGTMFRLVDSAYVLTSDNFSKTACRFLD